MIICTLLLLPLYILLQILVPVIQQVVTTVCSWVSSIIQMIVKVLSNVCKSLPWPFSALCNWVTTFVTVLQTVWNYICNTIIKTIITIIAYLISILIYVVHIVCIVIAIITGIPAFLLCLLGLNPPKRLRLCIKVLTDQHMNSAVTAAAIRQNIDRARLAFAECKIEVIVLGIEYIIAPQYLASTDCSASGLFSLWHVWFTQHACWCCNQVSVFFVDHIVGASGCTYWGDSWCRVDQTANADDSVMAHEVGHVLNLFHVNDPNNIMYPAYSPTAHNLTAFQCCLAKRSPFVTYF
jgi:matrixin